MISDCNTFRDEGPLVDRIRQTNTRFRQDATRAERFPQEGAAACCSGGDSGLPAAIPRPSFSQLPVKASHGVPDLPDGVDESRDDVGFLHSDKDVRR
jgi:hypothetical protein